MKFYAINKNIALQYAATKADERIEIMTQHDGRSIIVVLDFDQARLLADKLEEAVVVKNNSLT